MSTQSYQSLCILGRQPELGIAELEALFGPSAVSPLLPVAALIHMAPEEVDFGRLGGSIKLGRVLAELPPKWSEIEKYLSDYLTDRTHSMTAGKLTLGLSVYGMNVPASDIQRSLLTLKQKLRKGGRSVRIVPNREPELNSAQVLHNKLLGTGGIELLVVGAGSQVILSQTISVQDIEAYGARDQARPKRDARVGMLPPKLAQIIVNLAAGPASKQVGASRLVVLDPFCGTGVILQEALLMGYNVIGTDNEQRMIDFTNENIAWLKALHPTITGSVQTSLADATEFIWPTSIDAIASETYLGRALPALPTPDILQKITNDVNVILTKFLKNLCPQLKTGTRICLAVPAWRNGSSFTKLRLIDHLTEMGYNYLEFQHARSKDLIYWREGQIVGRQLLVLTKI